MEKMTKAGFLARLGTAVSRTRADMEPITLPTPPTLVASSKKTMAWGWAHDLEIFFEDKSTKTWNPVVELILMLSELPVAGPMALDHILCIEQAWEYVEKKQSEAILSDSEKIAKAIELAVRHGGTDEMHHLRWVVDQMVRTLAGDKYDETVASAKNGEEGPNTYEWHVGIAP